MVNTCLDCKAEFTDPPDGQGIVKCDCGVRYSKELLNEADPQVWAYVQEKRLFKRYGDELVVTDLVPEVVCVRAEPIGLLSQSARSGKAPR